MCLLTAASEVSTPGLHTHSGSGRLQSICGLLTFLDLFFHYILLLLAPGIAIASSEMILREVSSLN